MLLDMTTLFVVSTCVIALLGLFLLGLWIQDRSIRALGWWAAAYLIGGFAVSLWVIAPQTIPSGIGEIASALLFVCCGLVWSGARKFHGREPLPLASATGAFVWLLACQLPAIAEWPGGRVIISSIIIASYALLTSLELRRDRRNPKIARWRSILIPLLHGTVFLMPIVTMHMSADSAPGKGWFTLFALLALLYAVGTALIVVVMAKEHSLQVHRTAAMTDFMTGLFNRRGFIEVAQKLIDAQRRKGESVTVLMFDLDHFKSINDRFGHDAGDEALRCFAGTAAGSMRGDDIVGRLGGEEFAAILPGGIANAMMVAERVRNAFENAGVTIASHAMNATVSIGAADAPAGSETLSSMLARADKALYEAKRSGRNRVYADTTNSASPDARRGGALAPSIVPSAGVAFSREASVAVS